MESEPDEMSATEPIMGIVPSEEWAWNVELPTFFHPKERVRTIRSYIGRLGVENRWLTRLAFTRFQLVEVARVAEGKASVEEFLNVTANLNARIEDLNHRLRDAIEQNESEPQ